MRWWHVVLIAALAFALGAWWYYKHTTCEPCRQRSAEIARRLAEIKRRWALRWIE